MRFCLSITWLCITLLSTGCLFPAVLGTAGAVGSDAPSVWSHLGDGKGQRFCKAEFSDVVDAALRAGEALSLEVKEEKVATNHAFFRFLDAKNEKVDLYIERRSKTVTSIEFDVGWFGPVAFGHLVDQQIISELSISTPVLATEDEK